jgi:uncharacterized membrane protein
MKTRHALRVAGLGLASLGLAGCGPESGVRSSPYPAIPESFLAQGTEPFWGLTVAGVTARYSTPEITEQVASDVVRSASAGVETVSGRLGDVRFELTVRPERCSDGMSDRVYPYAAHLHIAERELQGCAAAK